MSAVALLLGEARFRSSIAQLKLDATISVVHDRSATITKNPIEARSGDPIDNFTDHVRLENAILNMEGFISEAPLSLLGSAFNIFTGAAGGLVGSAVPPQLAGFAQTALAAGVGSLAGLMANRNNEDP